MSLSEFVPVMNGYTSSTPRPLLAFVMADPMLQLTRTLLTEKLLSPRHRHCFQ